MPEKPDNEMERMLERYAEQRRGEPEVRMHSATRRMLQGEVKRTYAKRPRKKAGWFSRLPSRFWRRFWAYAAVTAVLAFIVADLVRPQRISTEMEMAQGGSEPAVVKEESAMPEPLLKSRPEASEMTGDRAVRHSPRPAAQPVVPSPEPAAPATANNFRLYDRAEPSDLPDEAGRAGEVVLNSRPARTMDLARPAQAPTLQQAAPAEQAIQILPEDTVVSYDWAHLEAAALPPSPSTNALEREPGFMRYAAAEAAEGTTADLTNAARAAAREAWEARILALAGPREGSSGEVASAELASTGTLPEARRATTAAAGLERTAQKETGAVATAGVETKSAEENLPATAVPERMSVAPREPVQQFGAGMTSLTNLGAAHRMWFLQMTNATVGAGGAVLPQFTVERLGEEIRFVDLDGSVYVGEIKKLDGRPQFEPATGDGSVMELLGRAMLKSTGVEELSITNAMVYNFIVQGTNRTLDAKVAVTGKFVERTNAPALRGLAGVAAGFTGDESSRGRLGALPKTKAAIVGAAVIGETNTVLFKALAPDK